MNMTRAKKLVLAAVLLVGATVAVVFCCSHKALLELYEVHRIKQYLRSRYGENKEIADGNYDHALAVKSINGTFVGKKAGDTIVFRGIPYVGRQPVGDLRWKAPLDIVPGDGVYEAYYNAKSAFQPMAEASSLYYQGEDCLCLNVWKPVGASAEKRPVIVWVHGGANEFGGTVDPLYDFRNFVDENPDVIVVSIAYRLGLPAPFAPAGRQGLPRRAEPWTDGSAYGLEVGAREHRRFRRRPRQCDNLG